MRAFLLAVSLGTAFLTLAGVADARARGSDGRFDARRSTHFLLRQDVAIDQRTGPSGARQFEREVLRVLEAGYDRGAGSRSASTTRCGSTRATRGSHRSGLPASTAARSGCAAMSG
jgi:hypothetical protein